MKKKIKKRGREIENSERVKKIKKGTLSRMNFIRKY